jgi:hypothetical protein
VSAGKARLPRDDSFICLTSTLGRIRDSCASCYAAELSNELQPGQVGEFIKEWARLEEFLLENARRITERNVSVREAIASLAKTGQLDSQQAILLDSLRRFRNAVVHEPKTVETGALEEWLSTTRQLWRGLRKEAT